EFNEKEKNNFQYVVIAVDEKKAKIERDQMVAILNAENILARRYFYPGCHKMEPYKSMPGYKKISLPVTDSIARQVVCLPSGTAISIQDVIQICEVIRYVCNNGSEIQHSCFQ
ncbi:MAG: DegT/DnrJ/EryC1/StrS family aminotransferase, partial [Candidatus Heimdallarchaeota archaeon]|nr:DegT/DnrJ/EryC1/StrS family aminotransferase [Candidatus Heimdallarchaeota archaeon]